METLNDEDTLLDNEMCIQVESAVTESKCKTSSMSCCNHIRGQKHGTWPAIDREVPDTVRHFNLTDMPHL